MVKELRILLASVSVAAMLSGCAKENVVGEETALCIKSVYAGRMHTKAMIEGPAFPDSEAELGIGLYLTASDGTPYDGKTDGYGNVKFYDDGKGWKSDSPVILSTTQGTLYAYFPYSSSVTDLENIPVQSSLDGTDYMCAAPVSPVSISDRFVELEMKHSLARLSVKLVKDGSFPGDGILSRIVLAGSGIGKEGTVDITDGTITAAADTVAFDIPAEEGHITASGLVKECLVVPVLDSDDGQDILLKCIIDGKEFSVPISGVTVRSGVRTDIEVSVRNIGLGIAMLEVADWDEGLVITVADGKKVRIEMSEDIFDNSFMMNAYPSGSSAVIEMLPTTKAKFQPIVEYPDSSCTCSSSFDENYRYWTFTISDIREDITVEAGYDVAASARTDIPKKYYYKDFFLDCGAGLGSMRTEKGSTTLIGGQPPVLPDTYYDIYGYELGDLAVTEHVEWLWDWAPTNVPLNVDILGGSEEDLNGVLLYPDGEPRFKMMYSYGGSAGSHADAIGVKAQGNVSTFYANGGSYTGSCAGTFLSAGQYHLFDNGSVVGSGMNLGGTYHTDIQMVPGTRFMELGGLNDIDTIRYVRHNGGPALNESPERYQPGTEVLARYSSRAYPEENVGDKSNLDKCLGMAVLWAYKRNARSGRLVACGSHPEVCNTPTVTRLYTAEILYALDGLGCATAKAKLRNGVTRYMNRKEGNPGYCGIGDNQYHHFVMLFTKDVEELTVNLDWNSRNRLDLGLNYENFAFIPEDGADVDESEKPYAFEKTLRELAQLSDNQSLSITARNIPAGMWYVSVHCIDKPEGVMHKSIPKPNSTVSGLGGYFSYTGSEEEMRTLNGVPYNITAFWTYK